MFYAIDRDTRSVESKHKKAEPIAQYILENQLEVAVILVGDEDDLSMELSIREMSELYENLTLETPTQKTEEDLARVCWQELERNSDDFPTFTPALGKKLVAAAKAQEAKDLKEAERETATKGSSRKTKGTSKPRATSTRIKLDDEAELTLVGEPKGKAGSILDTIVRAISQEMCSTVAEVRDYITSNHTIPKTGELADVKFADHNIKYFIKQGKLEMEDGL